MLIAAKSMPLLMLYGGQQLEITKRVVAFILISVVDFISGWNRSMSINPNCTMKIFAFTGCFGVIAVFAQCELTTLPFHNILWCPLPHFDAATR